MKIAFKVARSETVVIASTTDVPGMPGISTERTILQAAAIALAVRQHRTGGADTGADARLRPLHRLGRQVLAKDPPEGGVHRRVNGKQVTSSEVVLRQIEVDPARAARPKSQRTASTTEHDLP